MSTSAVGSSQRTDTSFDRSGVLPDRLDTLDTDAFLKLLIAELQNQDPMEPMDNAEMVQQISQIRSIESSQAIIDSFQSIQVGQNMSTAAGLLGKQITALTKDDGYITGPVDRVTMEDGEPLVHVGDYSVTLDNISEISTEAAE
jgi:flagellar basal-body rod modification protein FlgD